MTDQSTPESHAGGASSLLAAGGRKAVFARYGQRPSYGIGERSMRYMLRSLAYLTVGITFAILIILFVDAMQFFRQVSVIDFITGTHWEPFGAPKKLGVLRLLLGTLMVAIGSSVVAIPLGLGTAVYLTQYASPQIRNTVTPVVEVLGGIPTVVYGYFALTTVTPFLRNIFPTIEVFNALAASIVVGIAILPMISSLSVDALSAVPVSIRNAGYALGMRKFHVVTKIIIPAATSGIIASFILAFARAIGETMAVVLAAGSTPNMELDYLQGIQTMTAFIVQISLGDTPAGTIEYYTIYAIGLSLFLITFAFNILATRIVLRFREVYQ